METCFIFEYAKLISDNPACIDVKILKDEEDKKKIISLTAHQDDTARIIGKNGNMIHAMQNFLNFYPSKHEPLYGIQVFSIRDNKEKCH